MEPSLPIPQSNAETDIPAGTAESSRDAHAPIVRITQDGRERIYQDATIEIVNY